ncbi:MAG: hypothetical protein AAF633_24400 [Chloroflexota bacterium]
MSEADSKTLRKRARSAGERISTNSALRDHLNDDQAEKVVNWTLDCVDSEVEKTKKMSDKAVDKVLDDLIDRMTGIIKEIDTLVGELPGNTNAVKSTAAYEKFVNLVVSKSDKSDELQNVMHSFLNSLEDASADDVFNHCWAVMEEHYT